MIIDVHHHAGDIPANGEAAGMTRSRDRRLTYMDRFGIDQAVISPAEFGTAAYSIDERRRANDLIAEYVQSAPDRFVAGLGTVNPSAGDVAVEEVRRCIEELGLKGIVWHHRALGMHISHPGMRPILTLMGELKVPAFIHIYAESGMEAPGRLETLAEEHPDLQFVALDGFSSTVQVDFVFQMAKRRPNMVFDTGATVSVAHRFTKFIEEVGADRMLLGTDFYGEPVTFGAPFPLLELRDYLDIKPADRELILGGNTQRILNLGAGTV